MTADSIRPPKAAEVDRLATSSLTIYDEFVAAFAKANSLLTVLQPAVARRPDSDDPLWPLALEHAVLMALEEVRAMRAHGETIYRIAHQLADHAEAAAGIAH